MKREAACDTAKRCRSVWMAREWCGTTTYNILMNLLKNMHRLPSSPPLPSARDTERESMLPTCPPPERLNSQFVPFTLGRPQLHLKFIQTLNALHPYHHRGWVFVWLQVFCALHGTVSAHSERVHGHTHIDSRQKTPSITRFKDRHAYGCLCMVDNSKNVTPVWGDIFIIAFAIQRAVRLSACFQLDARVCISFVVMRVVSEFSFVCRTPGFEYMYTFWTSGKWAVWLFVLAWLRNLAGKHAAQTHSHPSHRSPDSIDPFVSYQ